MRERLPTMLERTGLTEVEVGFGGDTALASLPVRSTQADLGRIAAALLVNFILLAAFLRALVAQLYLRRVLKKIPVRPVTRAQPTLPDSPTSTTHLSRRPET